MKYSTKKIFLDANIFEENNFLYGNNIRSILHYSKIGIVQLFMTEISKMELIDRIKQNLIEVKTKHNELVRNINKTRILKNLNLYESIDFTPIRVDDSLNELTELLNKNIINSKIKVISAKGLNPDLVFECYYKGLPPFNRTEKKKYEFPDAFIIFTINNWCLENKSKMIFVTKDNDFNGFKSNRIIFRNNLPQLLSEITNYYDALQERQIIPYVKEQINHNKLELAEIIEDEIKNLISIEIDYERITDLIISKPKFLDFNITSLRFDQKYAEVTITMEIRFSFTIIPNPKDFNRLIFEDNYKPQKVTDKILVPCDIEVGFEIPNDIKIKWINNNRKICINHN